MRVGSGRFRLLLGAALALVTGAAIPADEACRGPAAVCESALRGGVALVAKGVPARIVADAADHAGVLRAARDLETDLSAVAGQAAQFTIGDATGTAIIIGTLGHSPRVDRIVREKRIDVRDVAGRWEAYLLQVVEKPEPGIDRALLIAGADKRGTIFGIYELARRMGVSPWYWWADVPVPQKANVYVAKGRFVDAPVVRYRGIFLNDENPALGGWMKEKFGGPNHQFYEHVFELILRLKGNALWPAMWGRAFGDDDPENQRIADLYGVVVGTSHHEPLMRADVEWDRYGKGPWDYTQNAAVLQDFWRRGVERMGSYESLVTIGMRGDGDLPMTQGTAIGLLERIVADQREIIADVTGKPAEATPQVWALYKEVQDYYDEGMRVPDDVTLLFSDDNWGNLRRLPEPGAKPRAGGYGIYYHFDYVGGPRNYKWINTVQIERVWEQMRLAHAYGADRLWIVNVGDLKPMEFPISFFLDYAWNPDAIGVRELQRYPARWAAEQFGTEHAEEIGELLTRYTQYNARRKPELLSPDTYSLVNFDEAERIGSEWVGLEFTSRRVGVALGEKFHDAWYQLVQYPILASANLTDLYVTAARNRLAVEHGRTEANITAARVKSLFDQDAELARAYQEDIAGGKWAHMMSQTHIGYTNWQEPPQNNMPLVRGLEIPAAASLGVEVPGDRRAWPGAPGQPVLPVLDPWSDPVAINVFKRGRAPLQVEAVTTQPWLHVEPSSDELGVEMGYVESSIEVGVDWDAVPSGEQHGQIIVRGSDGAEVKIDVPVNNPPQRGKVRGFVESRGIIAIEAEHYSRAMKAAGLDWETIPNLGRTLSGVTAVPVSALATEPGGKGPHLEYPLWLQQDGEVTVRVLVSPTLDFWKRGGQRFAVSIGDGEPQMMTIRIDPTTGSRDFRAWERAVSDSVHAVSVQLQVKSGAQLLKLWRVDPGVVFQRIEVARGTMPTSYLGPPESSRIGN